MYPYRLTLLWQYAIFKVQPAFSYDVEVALFVCEVLCAIGILGLLATYRVHCQGTHHTNTPIQPLAHWYFTRCGLSSRDLA